MEPIEIEVISHLTTIESVETKGPEAWIFTVTGVACAWYMEGTPTFAPGDRVKITITKEPEDGRFTTGAVI